MLTSKKTPFSASRVRGALGYLTGWAVSLVYWPLLLFFLIIIRNGKRFLPKVAGFWSRLVLKLMGIRLESNNCEIIKDATGKVVVFNHQSLLDAVWGASLINEKVAAIAKKELRFNPIVFLFWKVTGSVFIDRSDTEKAVKALSEFAARIRSESRTVFIAPEGTRSPDGKMLPFKKGAFRLAMEAEVPVYPVVSYGTFKLMPKHKLFPKSGTIRIKCLDPVSTQGWTLENLSENMERVRLNMIQAQKRLEL